MKKLVALTLGAFVISGIVITGSVTYAHCGGGWGGHGNGWGGGRGGHSACYQNDQANCPNYNEDCPYYRGR